MEPFCELDGVSLYHGDCFEIIEWLNGDVLVTDPPYGLDWNGIGFRTNGNHALPHGIDWDSDTHARDEALRLWGKRPAAVFGSWRQPRPAGLRACLIWNKDGMYTGPATSAFFTNHEEIHILGDGWRKSCPPLRSVLTTHEMRSVYVAGKGHPTAKPVGLLEMLIDRCPPGVVVDPFAGSGSTLLAARNLGRRAIGVEADERYCERIAERLGQTILPLSGDTE